MVESEASLHITIDNHNFSERNVFSGRNMVKLGNG